MIKKINSVYFNCVIMFTLTAHYTENVHQRIPIQVQVQLALFVILSCCHKLGSCLLDLLKAFKCNFEAEYACNLIGYRPLNSLFGTM